MEKRKYVLCEDGFENCEKDGKIIGFNVKMRIPYYRGVPLCLIGGIKIIVDGVEYPEEDMLITVGGHTFPMGEISTVTGHYWNYGEKAVITVLKDGGLPTGKHNVGAYAGVRISYSPRTQLSGGEAELEIA